MCRNVSVPYAKGMSRGKCVASERESKCEREQMRERASERESPLIIHSEREQVRERASERESK